MEALPQHLKKYVVTQDYSKYTPVDHAVWRYLLRQLRDFLSKNAHESYIDGLEKTGIQIDRIPSISEISEKLKPFGWRALPVSGFIPPAAFMELQALGVLPIASDMRSIGHLMYTPAPDIVHEAAGHAPILIHPEFSAYLRQYAQVAKKAIISREDLNIYEAIRDLSDIKENPTSTPEDIELAEKRLNKVTKEVTHVSEATILGRMNWWTAEYGLIGTLDSPKIFGAGLLSSLGESRSCLGANVKKIPLTTDCINVTYDITEPQPQLFVTPNFKHLSIVLDEMASTMAYKTGGLLGLKKAIQAQTVNTVELNSGIQITGQLDEVIELNSEASYLRFIGPSQLSHRDRILSGHTKDYHASGYGTAVGFLKSSPTKCVSDFTESDLKIHGIEVGKYVDLQYLSGVSVSGKLTQILKVDSKILCLSFDNCKVNIESQLLFDPEWGTYDLAIGSAVTSVFGGPADRAAFGETEDFVAARVPAPKYSEAQIALFNLYKDIRDLRDSSTKDSELSSRLKDLLQRITQQFSKEWLPLLELYELALNRTQDAQLTQSLKAELLKLSDKELNLKEPIADGLRLANRL
jgi:phenylalanine-4-hydroxylase